VRRAPDQRGIRPVGLTRPRGCAPKICSHLAKAGTLAGDYALTWLAVGAASLAEGSLGPILASIARVGPRNEPSGPKHGARKSKKG
jgi:hypothetical protein